MLAATKLDRCRRNPLGARGGLLPARARPCPCRASRL